jgi:hypothetical protein
MSIAAAVEQQMITTHEVADNIKATSGATERSAREMAQIVAIADHQVGMASQQMLSSVEGIGNTTDEMAATVNGFLESLRQNAADRRRFERIEAGDADATLLVSGQSSHVPVVNLSLGGVAVRSAPVATGTEVNVELPAAGGMVTGKAIRFYDGILAIKFADDPPTLARVMTAFQALTKLSRAA